MPYRWKHVAQSGSHEWLCKRNCALSPRQCGLWFASLAALSLAIATLFAVQGAWLVMPFALIEVSGLVVAFFWFGRHAADYEQIRVSAGCFEVITSVGPNLARVTSSSPWFRVEYSGGPRDLIDVVAGREHLQIGRFVPSDRRGSLATEIRLALCDAGR